MNTYATKMLKLALTTALSLSLVLCHPAPVVALETETLNDPLSCLAYNIYHEARGEGFLGMLVVADITLNRVESPLFLDSVCGVVTRGGEGLYKCAFSWYCDGLSDRISSVHSYAVASSIASQILLHGRYRGITEGSTHYHSVDVNPDWIDDRGMRYMGRVNNHLYYKWW